MICAPPLLLIPIAIFVVCSATALAGPNEGGVLLIHANPGLTYTTDQAAYCGSSGLAACSLAVTSIPADGVPRVFHVLAAFPMSAQPRLKAVSFGIDYDSSRVVILALGTCADFEVRDSRWPRPQSGTRPCLYSPQLRNCLSLR